MTSAAPRASPPLPSGLALTVALALAGCGTGGGPAESTGGATAGDGGGASEDDAGTDDGDPAGPRPARLVVTADWLNGTLSLLDYQALIDGAESREAALWKEIDLSAHPPGPYQVELTPGGEFALVASASGFFAGDLGNLLGAAGAPGGGSLLLVDLDRGEVVHSFDTPQPPMGLEISADGTRAFSANYGDADSPGDTMTVIDLVTRSVIEDLVIGAGPEQIDLSADGKVGVINAAGDGTIRLFDPADPGGTLSPPLTTSTDPSWPFFLRDGSDRLFVTESMSPRGISLVDAAGFGSGGAPALLDHLPLDGIPYAGAPFADGSGALVITTSFAALEVHRVDIDETGPTLRWSTPIPDVGGLPLGIAIDEPDGIALIPAPSGSTGNQLVIFDLEDRSYRTIPWMDEVGPTYLALEPRG